MVSAKIDIELKNYRGDKSTIFTGRPQGKDVRNALNLPTLDKDGEEYVFIIPDNTTSFNPSFYLGLLFDSYKKLGPEGFHKKYSFEIHTDNEEIRQVIEKDLKDGDRNAINSLKNKNPFSSFHS